MTLYRTVEVQNAVRHDFGIVDAITTSDEDGHGNFLP